MDKVFVFHGTEKRDLYRAVDQRGKVVDVLLREHRDLATAEAFFRRAPATTRGGGVGGRQRPPPALREGRSSARRCEPTTSAPARTAVGGETTKIIERSHVAMRV